MSNSGKLLFLLILCLFFSCFQPAAGETVGCVLTEDVDPYSPCGLSSDDSPKLSLPEIVGLPVEIVPMGLQKTECRENYLNTQTHPTLATNHPQNYLAISRIILPGLSSTQIGYPFHAFW